MKYSYVAHAMHNLVVNALTDILSCVAWTYLIIVQQFQAMIRVEIKLSGRPASYSHGC